MKITGTLLADTHGISGMNSRILVPYDGSEQSADALAYALASFPDDEIDLLHVVEPYVGRSGVPNDIGIQYDEQQETAESMLENARADHDAEERIETAVTVGRPIHETLAYTEDNDIDHIVIGSHGRDGAARLLLGSVAETVVRRSPVPVTVVRHSQQTVEKPQNVLVPFDGSTQSRRALTYAFDKFESADVTVLYVVFPAADAVTGATGYDDFGEKTDNWEEIRHDHVVEILDSAKGIADEYDRTLETAQVEGKPADAIVESAETDEIDHVVLGSTGRDGIARLLLGSVAETVVRRSPVSVTVAK
jgi:nucleotide-binding universal stress UspA family protein